MKSWGSVANQYLVGGMEMGNQIAKAGRLLCVESGAYSSYSITGFFVVLHNFDPRERLSAFLTIHPEQNSDYRFNDDEFLAFLIASGLLLEVDYSTMHMSNYASSSEFFFSEGPGAKA